MKNIIQKRILIFGRLFKKEKFEVMKELFFEESFHEYCIKFDLLGTKLECSRWNCIIKC